MTDRPIGIALVGSTGSIGTQTLDVIAHKAGRFQVISLAAGRRQPLLDEQVSRFRPKLVCTSESDHVGWLSGESGLIEAVTHPDVDIVVVASSGHAAILPTIRAIEAGKTIALANKEALVCAGELIVPLAAKRGVEIRPIDSEHSAIWQSLALRPVSEVRRLILTASGGPFRTWSSAELSKVTPDDALAHPTWSMGAKVTIDSATLMNKGLELIEAHWLFAVPYSQIDVIVHPQSIVHSIVEFADGSQVAQLGAPDMRLPIQIALTWPEHRSGPAKRLDLVNESDLQFESPDPVRFPAYELARKAGIAGGTMPTVLSAADEVAVLSFLEGQVRFADIVPLVQSALDAHQRQKVTLDSIAEADAWARAFVTAAIPHGRS